RMQDNDSILKLHGISKSFPGVRALEDVSFDVKRGAIHALVGENGAGKSTLIKILAGIYHTNEGTLYFNGTENVRFETPFDSHKAGIGVVHQEIKLADPLTVAENMFIGNLIYTKMGLVDWKSMRRRAKKIIDDLGIDINVNAQVASLSVAKQQIVEICKAVNLDMKLLIMDEPSATLTERELDIMFGIVRKLRDEGITVIYISHRLDEIFELADTVTVLRDGRHIDTVPVTSVTRKQLIAMMVGRELGQEYPKEEVPVGQTVLEAKGIVRKGVLKDISFSVRKGEIFGISGLVDSGRTELARALLGIDRLDSGELFVRGEKIHYNRFRDAIKDGLGLIPEDRKRQGLIQIFDVKTNICMVNLSKVIRGGIVRKKLVNQYGKEYAAKLRVVMPSLETQAQYLSGGNQQKVVVAKWLMQNSDILILDEPTRGIDVGAKTEIYHLITEMIKEGKTVIMISSEMPELLGMCDRIMVMHEGRKKGELTRQEASQEKIMALCV
ncbi:MAG: sugar ABC transporter ATP-binding protein, partial [Clostridia bacterium]|nr:sugar ABC transporter ATP-binding protein [Clostridia bacterium]